MAEMLIRGLETGTFLFSSFARPGLTPRYKREYESARLSRIEAQYRQRLKRAVKRLEAERLVEVEPSGDELIIRITETGKQRATRLHLERIEILRPKRWDGIWRVLGFDIPEKERLARDSLRQLLRHLGFYPLQKSVWVLPFPCRDEIEGIRFAFGLGSDLWYCETQVLDREPQLREYFELLDI